MQKENGLGTTIETYNLIAEDYVKRTKNLSDYPSVKRDLKRFIGYLNGPFVLDAGAGSCRDSLFLLNEGIHVEAIDLAEGLLRVSDYFPNSHKKVMDIRSLAYANRIFDGIWCNAVLLHLDSNEVKTSLCEFKRVLKPKGILYLSVKEGKGEQNVDFADTKHNRRFFTYEYCDLEPLLNESGFKLITHKIRRENDSENRYVKWLIIFACSLLLS